MSSLIHKEIIASLNSKNEKIVNKAFTKIRSSGKIEMLNDFIEIMSNTNNKVVYEGLKSILFEMKTTESLNVFIDKLKENKYPNSNIILLNAIWQSGLDATSHLKFIVEFALKSDYLTILECLTIVEECMEGPFKEEDIVEANTLLVEQLTYRPSEKDALFRSMAKVIQDFMIG